MAAKVRRNQRAPLRAVEAIEAEGLRDKINNTNVDDQQSMMLLQMDVQRWTMVTQMESNVLKSLQDGIKNTVSNLR